MLDKMNTQNGFNTETETTLKCECCGVSEWNGQQVQIKMYPSFPSLEQKQMCPNCISQNAPENLRFMNELIKKGWIEYDKHKTKIIPPSIGASLRY